MNNNLKIVHSIIDPKDLLSWVKKEYDVPDDLEALIFSYKKTEYYFLYNKEVKLFLKVYGVHEILLNQNEDCHFEIELLDFLKSNSMKVPVPFVNKKGSKVSSVVAPEGERKVILYDYIEAEIKSSNKSRTRAMGDLIGQFHKKTAEFKSSEKVIKADLNFILGDSIARFENSKVLTFEFAIEQFLIWSKEIRIKLQKLEDYKDNWGVIHGNFTNKNCMFDYGDENIYLMDFANSGYGWRHYDLAAFALQLWHEQLESFKTMEAIDDFNILWRSFEEGYNKHFVLTELEKRTIPYLMVAKELWSISLGLIPPFKEFNNNNPMFCIHSLERLLDDIKSDFLFK